MKIGDFLLFFVVFGGLWWFGCCLGETGYTYDFLIFVQFDSPFIWLQICGEYGVCAL